MFDNKIIFLIGKSASGKSTIESKLAEKGFEKITSHTTRQIRDDDVQGETYHFISESQFVKEMNDGNFLEHAKYNDNFYGIHKDSIKENVSYVVTVNPDGFYTLRDLFSNGISFLIKTDDKVRLMRALSREECPDCKNICERFLNDEKEFENIEDEVDYVIFNDDSIDSIVKKIIKLSEC